VLAAPRGEVEGGLLGLQGRSLGGDHVEVADQAALISLQGQRLGLLGRLHRLGLVDSLGREPVLQGQGVLNVLEGLQNLAAIGRGGAASFGRSNRRGTRSGSD